MVDASGTAPGRPTSTMGRRCLSLLLYVYSLYGIFACGAFAIVEWQESALAILILPGLGSAIGFGWLGSHLARTKRLKAGLSGVIAAGALGLWAFYSWYSGLPSGWQDGWEEYDKLRTIMSFANALAFEATALPIGIVVSWKMLGERAQIMQNDDAAHEHWSVTRRVGSVFLYVMGLGALLTTGPDWLCILLSVPRSGFYGLELRMLAPFLMLPMMLILAGMLLSPSKSRRAEGFTVAALALVLVSICGFLTDSCATLFSID